MDASIARIADYTSRLQYADLPAAVVHECKRRVIDTFGCALGAFEAEPSRIARDMAHRVTVPEGGWVLGTTHRTLPELAAFANGVMGRYLDGNDTFPHAGHPSDVIAPILAVAAQAGADGKTVITAITAAYEAYHAVFRGVTLREKGLDHVLFTGVGSAVGVARVLGLNAEETGNAVALAVTTNLALYVTRRGELSMWKGCAAGNAAHNAVFTTLMAAKGMTGPEAAIEGTQGLWDLVGRFEITPFAGDDRPYRITQSNLKYFLSEYHSQSPITAALQLHGEIDANAVEAITVHSYWLTVSEIGSDPEKWHPTTRETADHSLPYIIAAVLIDGRFSDEIFAPERLGDPRIHRLSAKIAVKEDPDFTRQFPGRVPCRIEARMRDGTRKTVTIDCPRGHYLDPMTDAEVEAKFRALARRVLPQQRIEQTLQLVWHLDAARSPDPIFAAMRIA